MGLIVNKSDFVGKYSVAQNSFGQLDNYIAQLETDYLYKLLGKELADLFIADLSNYEPQTQRFIDIYDAINSEVNGVFYETIGMKNMMLGFIYFEYMRYEKVKATISGNFANSNENAREVGFTELNLYGRYNESVETFNTLQDYIYNESATYPERDENTKSICFSHWSI